MEELLRYLTIVQFGPVRVALEDVTLDGRGSGRASRWCSSLPAANRDPAHFADPDRLDLDREPPRRTWPSATACTSAWASSWRGWRCGSASPTCSLAFPGCGWPCRGEQVRMRDDMFIYGVEALPVTWDTEGIQRTGNGSGGGA